MTVTVPVWAAVVIVALAALGGSAICALALAALIGKHPAQADPPVPGTTPVPGNAVPPDTAAPRPAPSRQPPAPGHWHGRPCGCAIRYSPPDILTCPSHAAQREDILHLLIWTDELKDRL